MELRQLSYFLAAAQTENFRRASELCYITQPALSRQIAALEEELDIQLFAREKQQVRLTAAGTLFVDYARRALDLLQQGEQELVRWKAGISGTLRIGSNSSLAASFVPGMLARFQKRFPDVRLQVQVYPSNQVVTLVEQGEVELGFIYHPEIRSELVRVQELFRQPLSLLVPRDHPLTTVPASERHLKAILQQEPLLLMGKETRLRKVVGQMLAHQNMHTQPVMEIDSIEGLKQLVREGCGITLIPAALLPTPRQEDDLTLLEMPEIPETYLFALIYSPIRSHSMAARQFIHSMSSLDEEHD